MHQNALIYFIKAPILGRVKTRLAKSIGDEMALMFYEQFVQKLLTCKPQNCDIFIAYDDGGLPCTLPTYLENHTLFLQAKGDLGYKMAEAFSHIFSLGYTQALLVGSDIPEVDEKILEEAFALLATSDATLSPTLDGGYYLIGFHAKTFTCKAFEGIIYGTSSVFEQTKEHLKPLHVKHGKILRDIDTLEDIKAYAPHILPKLPRISVIIPVYYEDGTLLQTIDMLRQNAQENDFEIIVIDTPEFTTINRLHVKDIRTSIAPKGRASQMNEGALMAQGDILLFLHADTRLPKAWNELIEKALHVNNAGAFSLGIDSPKRIFRIIESLVYFRTSWTKIPYGDQAHFFTSSFFKTLGCYTPMPLMEDIDIMKRVREKGEKVTLLDDKVLTSVRRWEKEGIFYTTLRNRVLSLLYYVGVAPKYLVKRYKPHR